jgi:hypothetical protein
MSGLPCAASTTLTDCGNLKIYSSKGQVDPGQFSEGKLASPGQRHHHFTNEKKMLKKLQAHIGDKPINVTSSPGYSRILEK